MTGEAAPRERPLARGGRSALGELARSALLAVALAFLLRGFAVEAFRISSASMVPSLVVGDHILDWKLAYGIRLPFANRWLLRWSAPRRGDVIVFTPPLDSGRDYIKRVIGLPGDVIELRDQVVYVNGVPQPRQLLGEATYDEGDGRGAWRSATCSSWRETLAKGPVPTPRTLVAADLSLAFERAAADGVAVHELVQCRDERLGDREGPFERVAADHVFVLGDNRDRSADSRFGGGWQVPLSEVKGKGLLVLWSWGSGGRATGTAACGSSGFSNGSSSAKRSPWPKLGRRPAPSLRGSPSSGSVRGSRRARVR